MKESYEKGLKDIGLKTARFIRITDLNNGSGDKGTSGFDLDAVAAAHSRPRKKDRNGKDRSIKN